MYKKRELWIVGVLLLLFISFGWFYCPFKMITGLPCPGCNMTHALIALLHFDLHQSVYYHAMLIPTFLVFLIYLKVDIERKKNVLILWCICMFIYYGLRMIYFFPNQPMVYDSNNVIQLIQRVFHS